MGRCSWPMNQPWVMGMKPQPPTTENRPALNGRHASCWNRLESVVHTVARPGKSRLPSANGCSASLACLLKRMPANLRHERLPTLVQTALNACCCITSFGSACLVLLKVARNGL